MKIAAAVPLAVLLLAAAAHAETITLSDGTQVEGQIVHADAKGVDVKTDAGKKLHLEKAKIRTIAFAAPSATVAAAPRAIYATPQVTLESWRAAALAADDAGMIDAYARPYQSEIRHQLDSMSFTDREQLLADVGATAFKFEAVKLGADDATLTVAQTKDGDTRTGDIHFVLENGEWKMTP